MQRVTRYQTLDGELHPTVYAATHHAERRYGDALTALAHRAIKQEKYADMVDFINGNLDAFAELKVLKADVGLEDGEND